MNAVLLKQRWLGLVLSEVVCRSLGYYCEMECTEASVPASAGSVDGAE
jgi:hypothetical protein